MSLLQLGLPPTPGSLQETPLDSELIEAPLELLEGWSQGDVEKINIRPTGHTSDPDYPHAQRLRGRNFADNTFTEVFRHSEAEQQSLVPTDNGYFFTTGAGNDDSAVGGLCLRFYARRPLESVAVFANLAYMTADFNTELTWSAWWDRQRVHTQGTKVLNATGFRENKRTCCFHWTTKKAIPYSEPPDLRVGWHEIRHTVTIRQPSSSIQIAIENAELTVFATYR